ncbi:MAG: hypothetical protein KBA66_13280 [Leptospiraceae bacterium]|nr:hypothetical protein [Leptospiraceae bacterium]
MLKVFFYVLEIMALTFLSFEFCFDYRKTELKPIEERFITRQEFNKCFVKGTPLEHDLAMMIMAFPDHGYEFLIPHENYMLFVTPYFYSTTQNTIFKSADQILEVDSCPVDLIKELENLREVISNCYIPLSFLVLMKAPEELKGKIKKIKVRRMNSQHKEKVVEIDLEKWLKKNKSVKNLDKYWHFKSFASGGVTDHDKCKGL